MCSTWQDSVPASGLTFSDQRQPGSNVPRPTVWPLRSTSSTRPLPSVNSRTSSGLSKRFPMSSAIAEPPLGWCGSILDPFAPDCKACVYALARAEAAQRPPDRDGARPVALAHAQPDQAVARGPGREIAHDDPPPAQLARRQPAGVVADRDRAAERVLGEVDDDRR